MTSPAGPDLARGTGLEIDIVISSYNYGDFLTDAIESACNQTHPETKVVVVDDGSTDGSRERLRTFADRVEVVLKSNGGQASAFNAGMERCRGDVVIFLDADDVLRRETAAFAAEAFAAEPGMAKLQFRLAYVDADRHPTGRTKPTAHLDPPAGDLRRAELAFPFDLPWLPGGGTAFRAEAVRRLLPIPEREFPRAGADWYLVHLTALLGSCGWVDRVGADYRVHGRNAYQPQGDRLDLALVRDGILYAAATTRALEDLADELGMERPDPILSVSDLAGRLISLRLEPELHPVAGDSVRGLLADGMRAIRRRFDVSVPMKPVFAAWFVAAAVSPRPVVRRLGELLLFPEGRLGFVNRALRRLRRAGAGTTRGRRGAGA